MKKIWIAAMLAAVLFTGYITYLSTPVHIGFLGPMTGRHSEMGINSRDAALLAADIINKQGGIKGRKVMITVFDDSHNEAACTQAVNELIKKNIKFVIGPLTSGMWPPAQAAAKSSKILFVSPTISADEYAGKDDNLIRINNLSSEQGQVIAKRLVSMGLMSAAVIYDIGNKSYSEPAYAAFKEYFESNGGRVLYANMMEKNVYNSRECAAQMIKAGPKAVVFICNGMDAASVAQQLSKQGYKGKLFGSMWTKTSRINELGGRSVRGMYLVVPYERLPETDNFKAVSAMYKTMYMKEMDFASINTYDAAVILFKGMSKAFVMTEREVKKAILSIREYECLQDTVVLDSFGDSKRKSMFVLLTDEGFLRNE